MTAAIEAVKTARGPEHDESFAILVEGMTVRFGSTVAIRNMSMCVPRNAIYGLVGPNGAGKTTTLRILATLQQPDSGTVRVAGIDLRSAPMLARARIGYLPDVFGVYEGLTVEEYLDFYAAIFGLAPQRRKQSVAELIELVGLGEKKKSPVKALSRGMRQQLGLARCLVHDPQVLLLDEPAAGLDPRFRLDLRDMLGELSRLGKTILISSHILSELAGVCTHLGFLEAGELIAEGSVDDIMNAVFPDTYIRVGLLTPADSEAAKRFLQEFPASGHVEVRNDNTLIARFSGTRGELAALQAQLSAQGIRMTEFTMQHPTLEDAFLHITRPATGGEE